VEVEEWERDEVTGGIVMGWEVRLKKRTRNEI